MIAAVIGKELAESRRDGRVLIIAGLIGLLALGSLMTAGSAYTEQVSQVRAAQRDDEATFVKQGEKPPHSAAHFGRMAHKPVAALAVFDPGAAPYLGQVVWLEAHRQGPAMFRPAEDAPELRRLADLSVAGILTMLLPLLMFIAGHGAFAAERERGTLRQAMSAGSDIRSLFMGKITALGTLGVGVCLIAIGISTALAVAAPGSVSTRDTLIRSVGLVLGYAAYGATFAAMALLVSARARDTRAALLMLLALWAVSIILVPRIAATVAERIYPTPDSSTFWRQTSDAMRTTRPARDSLAYRVAERAVLTRALGRDVAASEIKSLDINRAGLRLEVSEVLDAAVYAEAYRTLYETYEDQKRLRRLMSFLSPAIALQHFSSALAGTDVSAHHHFVLEAERQRNLIIREMNEDMMLNGVGQNDRYVASEDLWARVPDFSYSTPPASFAIRTVGWDLLVLMLWGAAAFWLSWRSACRQSPL